MRNLKLCMSLILGLWVITSSMYADNPRQTVTKELLSKTLSAGITTLDWVVRYESNSSTPLGDVVITDNFSSAQTYVPSTEAHPNGWSVTQSPNQFVWETTGDGLGYSSDFPTVGGSVKVPGSGDGYAPIPYTSLNGQKRFYYLNHHEDKSKKLFGCIGVCDASVGWPIKLPDGDAGSTETSGASYAPETVILGRKLYYGVTRANDSGIGCYDLENNAECGYQQLSTLSTSQSNASIDGLINIGSNLYIMDGNGIAYKVAVASNGNMTSVASHNMGMPIGLSSIGYYGIGSEKNDNYVYFAKGSDTATDRKIACLDTSTMNACSGWGTTKSVISLSRWGSNTFLYYSTSMLPTAICASAQIPKNGAPKSQTCLSLTDGSAVTRAYILPTTTTMPSTPLGTSYFSGLETTVGTKTYFPIYPRDSVFCHDWVAATSCSNNVIYRDSTESRTTDNSINYASAIDGDGCIWVYGHKNYLWSINPDTATSPCGGKALLIEDTYDASDNWCASEDVEWKYTQFQINGLSPNMFTDLNVTFYDASGNVIKVANLPSNATSFSQGLFTAPFIAGQPIHYKITGTRNPNANPNSTPPTITIGVEGPPREFCFQTTVPCPVTGDITNHVEVQLKGEHPVDSSADVVEDAHGLCEEVLPEPKQCLNAEPTLKCTKTGWTIDLDTFSPASFNASNTDMQVLAPSGATVTKWGNTWHVNGVSAGDTLSLSIQGIQQGAGTLEGGDLCCDGETNVTIPTEETCEVEQPHIYVRKLYDEVTNIFDLNVRIMNTIYAPQLLTVTDTIPLGITITGIDPRSVSEWSCTSLFPVAGPASLSCVYIGTMPVTGVKDLYLTSTVDNTQMPAENCADSGVVGTDGVSVYTNAMMHHCVTVEDNNTVPTDTNETNTSCAENEILIDGVCTQLPENQCPDGQQVVGEQCVEMPEINCQSNIILVVDRSDSIRAAGGTSDVRNMMRSFLDRFRGNGSQVAIIYFDTTASIVRPMSTINVGDIPPSYSPTTGGLTNWEDALEKTRGIVSAGDIVFFITDGQPNRYLNISGNVVPTGVPPALNTPALTALENLATLEASVVANQIKAMGARIVSVGVGSIGSSASAIQHLNDIASTPSDIKVNEFNELEGMVNDYASAACPDLLLTKKFIGGYQGGGECRMVRIIEENQKGTFEIKVQNTTTTPLSGIVVRDVLPARLSLPSNFISSVGSATSAGSTITWNVGTLSAGAVETLRFDIVLPAIVTNYEKIYNYAEVTNATGIGVMPLLANQQNGPLNINQHDESMACVRIYEYTPPSPCNPATHANQCLHVYKQKLSGEGNCIVGGECRYRISIRNDSNVSYTNTLNILDTMTPSSSTSAITITPQGSAPNPLCTPAPTAVPFSCTQTADIPANTTWSYIVVMSSTPPDVQKNTFSANGASRWFNFPSSNKQAVQEDNDTGCKTDKDCNKNEYCSEEDGLCLVKEHTDILMTDIPVIKPKPSKAHITLRKTAPKECKAGQKCTFKLRITNKGKSNYKGPLSITDKSKEFVGKLVRTSPRGWRCKRTRRGYVCSNPKVSLKAGDSTTVKLTVRIPQRAKGYLNNCAKLDFLRGKERIKTVQKMLLQNGFDPHGIDGGMGRGTKKALKSYMKSKGIRSQREAMKTLVKMYPHVTSKNSCVKVKIKKSKIKCKKYEKLVRDVCKPRCKKWQHWDGRHCVSCPKGTQWDKRKKVCKEVVCAKGLKMVKGQCVKVKKAACIPFITHYNSFLGICVPNISIGIGGGGSSPKGHDNGPAGY